MTPPEGPPPGVDDADVGPPRSEYRKVRVSMVGALQRLSESGPLAAALVRREFQARYKQTRLGLLWALVTPVALLLVFSQVFNRVADLGPEGESYALFAYMGLLPWTFFASSLSRGGQALVLEARTVARIRAPREIFPLSFIAVSFVDSCIATTLLPLLFLIEGEAPAMAALWVPLPLLLLVVFTVGAVLTVAAIVVFFRDLQQVLPLVLQLGLFATPVAYGIEVLATSRQILYAFLNPMVGVIATLRATVLDGDGPPWRLLGPSAATSCLLVLGGYWLFKRLEPEMADVA